MPRIQYRSKRFAKYSLQLIEAANIIIEEYQRAGYDLTLRQLYYQFVARGWLPNTVKDYNKLGEVVSDGRLAGLIDWNAIVDRTRSLEVYPSWNGPEDILLGAAESFHLDRWANQDYRVEVWIEKEALAGVLAVACPPLDVPYFSCKGYTSQSELWSAARRIASYVHKDNKVPVIIHLGDHDPSGIDMTRDIDARLGLFLTHQEVNSGMVERIALNMNQVEELMPPPNPAKTTDTRFREYMRRFGNESWELDALDPMYITNLITRTVSQYIDPDRWEELEREEKEHKDNLKLLSDNYLSVRKNLLEGL